jgi:LysM repeat protein
MADRRGDGQPLFSGLQYEGIILKRGVVLALVMLSAVVSAFYFLDGVPASLPVSGAVQQAGLVAPAESRAVTQAAVTRSEVDLLLEKGVQALQAGSASEARTVFTDLLKRFPNHPAGARAALELSKMYAQAGDEANRRSVLAYAAAGLPDCSARASVVTELNRVNGEIIFSRKMSLGGLEYVVKRGDSLFEIGRRFRITPGFIQRINAMTSDRLDVGQRLKVMQGPFDVVIEKSRFRLTVYHNGAWVKEYPIGLGKDDSTPEGDFLVRNKLVDPVWDPPGPEYAASKSPTNPLGPRWIGFNGEYGIHGTIEPETIGKTESRGCIRMFNADVLELYDILVEGSKVTVRR